MEQKNKNTIKLKQIQRVCTPDSKTKNIIRWVVLPFAVLASFFISWVVLFRWALRMFYNQNSIIDLDLTVFAIVTLISIFIQFFVSKWIAPKRKILVASIATILICIIILFYLIVALIFIYY